MPRTKLIHNDPRRMTYDSLEGLAYSNPLVTVDLTHRVVYRQNLEPEVPRVTILSGGGSGHEPAHAGFVGSGLLDAAICGNVFASPNVKQIRKGLDYGSSPQGSLVVTMNYSGDALHFGLAASKPQGSEAGPINVLLVGDDVSVGRQRGGIVGRRGMAGTVLIYKIAAALAQQGKSLEEVDRISRAAANRLGTYAVGLEHCHVPGTTAEALHLQTDQIELGMGIHNESGVAKIALPSMSKLVDILLTRITDVNDEDAAFVPFSHTGNDRVILLVNNLGGLSELELGAVTGESVKWLRSKTIQVERVYSGTYMTALSMPGFSLSVMLLPNDVHQAQALLDCLDSPAAAPGWKTFPAGPPGKPEYPQESNETTVALVGHARSSDPIDFLAAIIRACEAVIEAEPEITRQDIIAGDGDAGLTLRAGAEGVLDAMKAGKITGQNVLHDIVAIADVAEEVMGGTSGSLYSIFFSGLAAAITASGALDLTAESWSIALDAALNNLYKYTRARPPSRTLMDPLEAFVTTYKQNGHNFGSAAQAALDAANDTKKLVAMAGRGSYVNQEDLLKADIPDPGAWGVWRILDGLQGYKTGSQT